MILREIHNYLSSSLEFPTSYDGADNMKVASGPTDLQEEYSRSTNQTAFEVAYPTVHY